MKEHRNTKQREEVLNSVKALCNHPSAEEVYDYAREKNPNISKGTVYRNLNLLTDLNEISKVEMPGNEPDRFDVRTDNHHHAFCRICRKLYDFELDEDLSIKGHIYGKEFISEKSQLILTGICQDCLSKEKE